MNGLNELIIKKKILLGSLLKAIWDSGHVCGLWAPISWGESHSHLLWAPSLGQVTCPLWLQLSRDGDTTLLWRRKLCHPCEVLSWHLTHTKYATYSGHYLWFSLCFLIKSQLSVMSLVVFHTSELVLASMHEYILHANNPSFDWLLFCVTHWLYQSLVIERWIRCRSDP